MGYRTASLDLEDNLPPSYSRLLDSSMNNRFEIISMHFSLSLSLSLSLGSRAVSVSMEYLDLLSGDIIISFEHITLLECIGKGTFRIDIQFIIISGIPDIIMNNVGDSTVYVGIPQCSLSVFLSFFLSYSVHTTITIKLEGF